MELAGLDPETALESEVAAVGEATSDFGPDLEPEYSSQLDELLASLPERERERYERMHAEERKRYELMREQVRKDYERGVSRIREIAQLEIKNTRKPGDEGGDE